MLTDKQQQLVLDNQRLTSHVMRRYFPNQIPTNEVEDFRSIGYVALCKAAATWDESISKFSTWACYCIRNEYLIELRKRNAHKRIPAHAITSYDELILDGVERLDTLPDTLDVEGEVAASVWLERLSDRERLLVQLRIDGYRQQEISAIVGLSQAQVSRLLTRIGKKLVSA